MDQRDLSKRHPTCTGRPIPRIARWRVSPVFFGSLLLLGAIALTGCGEKKGPNYWWMLMLRGGSSSSAPVTATPPGTAATPVFSPTGGTFSSDQSISISTTTPGANIYYTTNGATPTTGSTLYSTPIAVAGDGTSKTIQAIAVATNLSNSSVASATFTINYSQVSTPQFTPATGLFTADQSVTIMCSTSGATVYYTTDGNTPTTSSSVYSGAIPVAGNGTTTTIQALAVKSGMSNSSVGSATYTIAYPAAATPVFSPTPGTYTTDQGVTLMTGTSGASIYYTANGTTPSTGSTLYTGPISVSGNGTSTTIKAIAAKSGMSDSGVATGAYTINYTQVSTPSFSPAAGTFGTDQNVTITCATSGVSIYYTTDGNTPTTSSTYYTGAIPVSGNGTSFTIKAIAVKGGMLDSTVASGTYTINYPPAATPTFSPTPGTFTTDQAVSLSTTTLGASIYYTTNGTTPSTGSTLYTSPIAVAGNGTSKTIKAIAAKAGMTDSAIASGSYTISYAQVSTPQFSPAPGGYASGQTITIIDGTSGATIYYTTNGSAPTTASSVYSSPVSIGTGITLRAIAVKSGMLDSTEQSGAYTTDTTPPTVISTTPANAATGVSPLGATITVTFSEPMNTSLTQTLTTEAYDGSVWGAIPNTGSTLTWTNSTTLTITLSWIRFPEMTQLRWTLAATGLKDLAGNQIAANVQQTFTTTIYNVTFPVADTGQTLCYNASASQPCNNSSWPGQDADNLDVPNARNFTGPTAHATYTSDYTTTDNVTGLVWKTCTEGLSGSTCGSGGASTATWYNALNVCAAMNSVNSGAGYAGRTNWRLPTVRELQTLPNFGMSIPAIDTAFFPATVPNYYWVSTAFGSSAWYVYFVYGYVSYFNKTNAYNVRCVSAGP